MPRRHNHSWQHCSTPEKTLSTKHTPLRTCLLLGTTGLWTKEKPIPWLLTKIQNIQVLRLCPSYEPLMPRLCPALSCLCSAYIPPLLLLCNIAEESRQPAVSVISIVLKVVCSALPAYSGTILSFSDGSWRLVILPFLFYHILKNLQKRCKVYKGWET